MTAADGTSSPPTPTPPGSEARVEELVAQALGRLEDSGSRGLEDFLVELGAEREGVEEQLRVLRENGLLSDPEDRVSLPPELGDYRIGRMLGAGGMGLVFEAEQLSLQRAVALKVIRPEYSVFESSRLRFLREAEAVARLSHPGIVQVIGFGEDQGHLFYTMELVRGASLAHVVRQLKNRRPVDLTGQDLLDAIIGSSSDPEVPDTAVLPELFQGSWIDCTLRIGREVAQALEHAHSLGVLHRDVKPSNILVTPTGRAVLLDFGLAALSGSTQLTRTSSRIGSPLYQTPESLEVGGAEAGSHTDVYSLGITLQELLTLARPFEGNTPAILERRVREGQPRSIGALHPRARGDVETVIRTATDLDPQRRYGSAALFAADLASALEHRPIQARPNRLGLRAQRWARRHSEAAAAIAVLGGLLLVLVTWFAVHQTRTTRDLSEALRQTEETLGSAQEAVTVLVSIANSDRLAQPEFEALRDQAARGALSFYDELADLAPENPGLRTGQARAHISVGLMRVMQDRYVEAMEECVLAAAICDDLLAEQPDHLQAQALLGQSLSEAGAACRDCGRLEQGLAFAERSRAVGAHLWELSRSRTPPWPYINAIWVEAEIRELLLDFPGSEAAFRELIDLEDAFMTGNPNAPRRRIAAINTIMGYGRMMVAAGRFEEAIALTNASQAELEAILEIDARVFRGQEEYGRLMLVRGLAFRGSQQPTEALDCFRLSAEAYSKELRYSPDHPRFNRQLSETETEYGDTLLSAGESEQGLALLRGAYERLLHVDAKTGGGLSARRQLLRAGTRLLPHMDAGADREDLVRRLRDLHAKLSARDSGAHPPLDLELEAARVALAVSPER